MIKRIFFSLTFLVSLTFAQNQLPDAIVEKYIEAVGGQSLQKINSEKLVGRMLRGVTGKVPFVVYSDADGKWRYDQTFAWGDQMSFRFDGKEGWIADTDSIWRMPESQRHDMQLIFDMKAPLKIKELYSGMTILRNDSVNGKNAIVLSAKTPDGRNMELAFDRESGFLLKAGSIYFDDYRAIDSIMRPHKILLGEPVGEEHKQMVMEFSKIIHTEPVNDTLFAMPSCRMTPKEAPLYKRRIRVEIPMAAMDACVGRYRDPNDTTIIWEVARQGNNLMITRTGIGTWNEIMPESEADYYIQFLNAEFHFQKDSAGAVTELAFGPSRSVRAIRIK
jgi:hypothetical protein